MNHFHYAWLLLVLDRYEEAVEEHELAKELDPFTPFQSALLGWCYLYGGDTERAKEEARRIAAEMEARELIAMEAFGLSVLYGALGDVDSTYRWLTHEPNHAWRPAVWIDPIVGIPREVLADPRFEPFLERLNLPWTRE